MNEDSRDDADTDGRPSKSAAKREAQALQELGESLLELPPSVLAGLPLPEELREAIALARSIRQRGGLRRQRQLIGKIMRRIDAEPIRAALAAREQAHRGAVQLDHRAERWRDRLLEEGDGALAELLARHPGGDSQAFRTLLRAAAATDTQRATGARRELFRSVRRLLAGGG
jgi:ribosome-associated protein